MVAEDAAVHARTDTEVGQTFLSVPLLAKQFAADRESLLISRMPEVWQSLIMVPLALELGKKT